MNPMMLLNMVFGNKAQEMMNKWNSMSPEQKQAELSKVSNMTNEQKMQYLKSMGFDTNLLNGLGQQQNIPNNQGGRFSY